MSSALSIIPLIAALISGSEYFKHPRLNWRSVNKQQEVLCKHYLCNHKLSDMRAFIGLDRFNDGELIALASNSYSELNKVLKDHDYDFRFKNLSGKGNFGVVSILNFCAQWRYAGQSESFYHRGRLYPAVEMAKGFVVYTSHKWDNPIVEIECKNPDDKVYITLAGMRPFTGFSLLKWIQVIEDTMEECREYSHILFPKVNLQSHTDYSWLLGLGLDGHAINRAVGITRIKLDENGALAKSCMAAEVTMGINIYIDRNDLIIDRPFYMWIKRRGIRYPLVATYVDEEAWKN